MLIGHKFIRILPDMPAPLPQMPDLEASPPRPRAVAQGFALILVPILAPILALGALAGTAIGNGAQA